uniref:uncharacterized protein LOC109963238 n=1 Tax=Monopterus albus TaxID=43700 RepID=UPI0009B4CAF2|nr:uncharacterized protein LOC109963238 [Monopterus albus]
MPGVDRLPSEHHGNVLPTAEGSYVGEEVRDMEGTWSESLCLFTSSPLGLNEEEMQRGGGSWSQDGDLQGCGQVERKWILWHEFMKEHAHLDAWLQLAEQDLASPDATCVTYLAAKEELRKFEMLRCEVGSRLVQLDNLIQKNRVLARLFQGVMQARLLASARECGRRWDDVNTKLEAITGRLKLFVSQWEEFEAEREELALLLADLDVRLTEVEHLNGNTCEKLRRLQSFQQCVCVNSDRVNALLQHGEALIQRCEPTDAQHVESRLLELLRRCNNIYSNIARTHTRLLSMRLVFEDDWILSQATDSGCPSESLLEEEGAPDKPNLDLPVVSNHPDASQSVNPPSPTHEHMGLEWDPSVDIGRSVSHDDADSSYFSAKTGVCHRDGLKRRSYLSSIGSQSDISNDVTNPEADVRPDGWPGHAHHSVFSPVTTRQEKALLSGKQWVTSTPDTADSEADIFDGGRVRAWLGVQSPAPPPQRTSCSRAVQTVREVEDENRMDKPDWWHSRLSHSQRCHDNTHPFPAPSPSHDLKASCDLMSHQYQSDLQDEEEPSICEESELPLSEQSASSSSRASPSLLSSALLYLLLAAALALLAFLVWVALEPPCHRSGRMHRSFHLALRYINGPPPT